MTADIILERYSEKYEDQFIELVTNTSVMNFVDGALDPKVAYNLFQSFLIGSKNEVWLIKEQETGKYIGHAALTATEEERVFEILLYLKQEYWGKGLATQAGKEVIKWAKSNSKVAQVKATLDIDHIASQKICEKIGLSFYMKDEDEIGEFLIYSIDL